MRNSIILAALLTLFAGEGLLEYQQTELRKDQEHLVAEVAGAINEMAQWVTNRLGGIESR